jgi:hypothetical protein
MKKTNHHALVLTAMVEALKERGMSAPGTDYALACYQALESVISEAEVWDLPLSEIGLEGFNTAALLEKKNREAA